MSDRGNSGRGTPDEAECEGLRERSLFRSTSIVGGLTMVSRVTGLARDIGFSHWFGAGIVMDAFFVAFKIPNLFRRFFAEGAFSLAFVPLMAEYRSTRTPEEARAFVDRVSGTLALALLVVTAIGVIAAPLVIVVFAPGFIGDGGRFALATDMLRWTFPYLFFISLTALAGGILNTYREFAVPAATPTLLNLVLIGFAAFVAPSFARPGIALAVGVFVAGAVQLAFQVPFLIRMGLLPRPRWAWTDPAVKRVLRLMLPVVFGSSVAQINILIDTLIASFLVTGSISWLYYSDRLMEFPLGVVGIALGTVILPSLSEHHAKASPEDFARTVDWALRVVLLVAVPAALGLALLARPLLATIFFGGAFSPMDVSMSTASLRAFAPGLIGFMLIKVLAPAFFARQDTRTPVKIAVAAFIANTVLNVLFVLVLTRTHWMPAHAGLALATSLSGILNAALLFVVLARSGIYQPQAGWWRLGGQIGAGSVALVAFVLWMLTQSGDWLQMVILARCAWLLGCVLGAVVVYFAVAFLFGFRLTTLGLRAGKR